MENWLRCTVTIGQLPGEYGVEGLQANGAVFSLFAPTETVEPDEEPTRDQVASGWVKVVVLDQSEGRALVRLPRQTFQSGAFVTVGCDQLRTPPRPTRRKAVGTARSHWR